MAADQQVLLDRLTMQCNGLLSEIFREHGLNPCFQEGWLHTGVGELVAGAFVEDYRVHPSSVTVQVGFDVFPWPNSRVVIRDTLVGVGESDEAALFEAVSSWLHGVSAPIRAALGWPDSVFEGHVDELAAVDPVHGEQTSWAVYAGPFQMSGKARGSGHAGEVAALHDPLVEPTHALAS
jgi:uncharacterized protein DUF6348